MTRPVSLAMLWCVLLAAPVSGWCAPRYSVTVVGPAGSAAYDINSSGQIAGNLDNGSATAHAFFYDGNRVHDIAPLPGALTSMAGGLNDLGVVVGTSGPSDGPGMVHGFIYDGGAARHITPLLESTATAINNAGTAVGMGLVTNLVDPQGSLASHAVAYFGAGYVDLTSVLGDSAFESEANDINQAGNVVITARDKYTLQNPTPYMVRDGQTTALWGAPAHWYGTAVGINNHDQAVGLTYSVLTEWGGPDMTHMQAILYDHGVDTELGTLQEGGNSGAWGINDAAHVVGWTDTLAGVRAFLYVNGDMTLLDDLIEPGSGWFIVDARAINEDDQIAATACKAGICQAVRLDVLSAVPEPVHWRLWSAGLLLLAGRRASRSGIR